MLAQAARAVVDAAMPEKIGVAFSGGVDSTLLARLCSMAGHDMLLLTIGLPGSHDVVFARDVGRLLGLEHRVLEIDPSTFESVEKTVRKTVPDKLSWIENGIAFHYISELAKESGIEVVAAANGLDELFCGYDAYRREYSAGEGHLSEMIVSKMQNEISMMESIRIVTGGLGVSLVQPFLSDYFAEFAKTISISAKITGPEDYARKHPVRSLAREVGVPEVSYTKRKKALQYGTGIHKMLKASRNP